MKSEINLLPIQPLKKKGNKIFLQSPWLKLVLALVVISFFIYGILYILNRNCLEEIKQVEEVINNQRDFRFPYENLITENELLTYNEKVIEVLNQNKMLPLNVLGGVSDVLPLDTELVDYQFKDNQLTLAGNTHNQEKILEFRESLMALGLFKNVTIQNTIKKQVIDGVKTGDVAVSVKGNVWDFIVEIEILGADKS